MTYKYESYSNSITSICISRVGTVRHTWFDVPTNTRCKNHQSKTIFSETVELEVENIVNTNVKRIRNFSESNTVEVRR